MVTMSLTLLHVSQSGRSVTNTSRHCLLTCIGCGSLNASSTNSVYWFSTACTDPRRDIFMMSSFRSRTPSHDVVCALPLRQTWPYRPRVALHWATAPSPWPVRVFGTLCPMQSGGAHRPTLSNAHWKLIYTFSVTFNTFIRLSVSRDFCIVSLKWLTYGTLNPTILHYITLHYITIHAENTFVEVCLVLFPMILDDRLPWPGLGMWRVGQCMRAVKSEAVMDTEVLFFHSKLISR